jgi:catalase
VVDSKTKLTTEAGIPVGDNRDRMTVGQLGPLLVQHRPSFSKD